LTKVCYSYGQRLAVDSVSFDIEPGEMFGLLGPNGAGKTTTISCIAGLLRDFQGEMRFRGEPFRPATNIDDRAQIGFVPQELAIYDKLSAEENLRLFAKLMGVPASEIPTRVSELLDLAGLVDRRHDRVQTYSGGMKRRLNLAAGLLHRPSLVLLDEPTAGVDPQSRNHLFESIQKLKMDGVSVLYTTHYMEEAERLCDRIAIMNEGRIIAIGTPRELAAGCGLPDANLETVFLQLTGRSLRNE